jgi:hypothetical protein
MARDDMKALLLQTIEQCQRHEAGFAALCDDLPGNLPERWTVKDHVAHLAAWREHAVAVLDAATAGVTPPSVDDIDAANANTYDLYKITSAADVVSLGERTYARLLAAIESCPDERLYRVRDERSGEVWRVVPPNGHAHLAQHLIQWYLEEGDVGVAEATALWAKGLDDMFTDTRSKAVSAYNLACFYAKAQRAGDAVPLLEQSLQLVPTLRESAASDPDFDNIRDKQEFRRLVEV